MSGYGLSGSIKEISAIIFVFVGILQII